jgi:hypothetical protein
MAHVCKIYYSCKTTVLTYNSSTTARKLTGQQANGADIYINNMEPVTLSFAIHYSK